MSCVYVSIGLCAHTSVHAICAPHNRQQCLLTCAHRPAQLHKPLGSSNASSKGCVKVTRTQRTIKAPPHPPQSQPQAPQQQRRIGPTGVAPGNRQADKVRCTSRQTVPTRGKATHHLVVAELRSHQITCITTLVSCVPFVNVVLKPILCVFPWQHLSAILKCVLIDHVHGCCILPKQASLSVTQID